MPARTGSKARGQEAGSRGIRGREEYGAERGISEQAGLLPDFIS